MVKGPRDSPPAESTTEHRSPAYCRHLDAGVPTSSHGSANNARSLCSSRPGVYVEQGEHEWPLVAGGPRTYGQA